MADATVDNGDHFAPLRLYFEGGLVKILQGEKRSFVIHPSAVPALCDAMLEGVAAMQADRLGGRNER